MSEPDLNTDLAASLGFSEIIVVRWDDDEGRPVYDLGEMDPWAAAEILRQVLKAVRGNLPYPRDTNDDPDEDDEC